MISYTVHGQKPISYQLTSRQLHPFLERFSMVPLAESEADDTDIAEQIVSIVGNDSFIQVIVIEDTVDSTWLPPTVFTNNPNVQHVYRVQMTEQMKQHAVQFEHGLDNVALIKLDRWKRLSYNGAGLFPDACKGITLIHSNFWGGL